MLSCTSSRCGYLNTAPTPAPRKCPYCGNPLAHLPTLGRYGRRADEMHPAQRQELMGADASPFRRPA